MLRAQGPSLCLRTRKIWFAPTQFFSDAQYFQCAILWNTRFLQDNLYEVIAETFVAVT